MRIEKPEATAERAGLPRPEIRRPNGSCAVPPRCRRAANRSRDRLAAAAAASRPAVAGRASFSGPGTCAMRASAARTALTAPSVTSLRYRLLLHAAAHRKRCAAPDRARVELRLRLQHGHAPAVSPRKIAQSSADGPRSPGGPGCTMRHRCRCQSDAGIARFKNGARITSGFHSSTASLVTRSWMSSSTDNSWPSCASSTYSRCAEAVE